MGLYGKGVFIIFIKPTYTINIIKINVETNSYIKTIEIISFFVDKTLSHKITNNEVLARNVIYVER